MTEISSDTILDSLFDGVLFVDVNRRITFWNKAAERITGFEKAAVRGTCCIDNILRHFGPKGRKLCLDGCPLAATIVDGKLRESKVHLSHKLGHRVAVSVRTTPVRDEQGNIVGAVEVFSDNSSHLQILHEFEKLKQDVYLDPLTGLGNRRYGEMTLTARIEDWYTNATPFGVLFIDIDHFKNINDTYGHKIGDDILVMVANSISLSLRKMDVAARWGGEEFIVVLPGATKVIAKAVSERIRVLIGESFVSAGDDALGVTVSIGVTMSRADDSVETVVNRADRLMYQSKSDGRNRVTEDE